MKKIIGIVLCLTLVLAALGCSARKEAPENIGGYTANEHYIIDAFEKAGYERLGTVGKITYLNGKVSATSQEQDYPETFDLRSVDTDGDGVPENYVTSVKYQNPFGTCWAFGTIAAAETSILYELGEEAVTKDEKGNPKDAIDLSEHHLGWFAYTPMPEGDVQEGEGLYSQVEGVEENPSNRLNSGSTQFAASTLFASGCGPLLEPDFETAEGTDAQLNYHGKEKKQDFNEAKQNYNYSLEDDWSVDESQRFRQSYILDDVYFLPSPVSFDEDHNYDKDYADSVSKAYKEQLMNGRAIVISFCADNYRPNKENAAAKYINTETWAHYCYSDVISNHVVTVVGWDDNYSRKNFLSEVQLLDETNMPVYNEDGTPRMKEVSQPPADGAWIVKNSWGSTDSIGQGLNYNHWGIEDSGYFYLSYYDQTLDTATCFDFDVNNELKTDLGQYVIDENDFMPCELPRSIVADFSVATANAFTAEENQTLKAISCVTTEVDEEVEFEVYLLDRNDTGIEKAERVASFSETFPTTGLHLTRMEEPISIEKGQSYAVAVRQKCAAGYLISVGCEYNEKAYKAKMCSDAYAAEGVVNPGESFLYLDGEDKWWDLAEVKADLEGDPDGPYAYLTLDNFPIKAYASIDR